MKKLKAPFGSEGANIGTRLFKPDSDGNVMVPDDAVPGLVGVGGFEIMPIPDGYVLMRSLIGAQSVTTHGASYETDGDNMIAVPRDYADDLLSHNFEYIGIKAAEVETVAEEQTGNDHVEGDKDAEALKVPLGIKPPEPEASVEQAEAKTESAEEASAENQTAETAEPAKSAE